MQTLIDSIDINYKVYGLANHKVVVLLHGWGTDLESVSLISKYLSTHFKVYALDLPGFGHSMIPPTPLSIIDYAKIIKAFLIKFKIDNPILIGHSFGGRIIITLNGYLNYPADKIILINSAGLKPKRTLLYYIKIYTYKFLKLFKNLLSEKQSHHYLAKLRSIFGSKDYNNVTEVMKRTLSLAVNYDLKKYLPHIKAPTLLIWGHNDKITPLKDGMIMQKLIPDAGLVIFKEAGHYVYLEKHDEVKAIILYFLTQKE